MTVVSEQEHEAELPERWSAKAKTDVVLRLLRGESVDAQTHPAGDEEPI
jgi:hypothetical protein